MRLLQKTLIACFLVAVSVQAQKRPSEIGLLSDNDLYTSSKFDMYYTNGLEVFYRFGLKVENNHLEKKSNEFSIGQYLYTPRFIDNPDPAIMDRPYAGYLFAKFGQNRFYKNQSVLKTDFKIGYVGPNAFGSETQSSFHKLVGYKAALGWEYQIKNALALQTHFLFSKKILTTHSSEKIDFHWKSEAQLGTIFTGMTTGIAARFALKPLVSVANSNFYDGGALGSRQSEFYFYIAPSINYQLYDATIQGSLFSNNSPITFNLVPFRFNTEAGFKYKKKNLNLSYVFVYRGKELYSSTSSGYFYGSIGLSYFLNK
jgi:hypothetical protein